MIQENSNFYFPHALFHLTLEGTWGICHSLGFPIKLTETKWAYEGSLGLISLIDLNLIIARLQMENTEPLATTEHDKGVSHPWDCINLLLSAGLICCKELAMLLPDCSDWEENGGPHS